MLDLKKFGEGGTAKSTVTLPFCLFNNNEFSFILSGETGDNNFAIPNIVEVAGQSSILSDRCRLRTVSWIWFIILLQEYVLSYVSV